MRVRVMSLGLKSKGKRLDLNPELPQDLCSRSSHYTLITGVAATIITNSVVKKQKCLKARSSKSMSGQGNTPLKGTGGRSVLPLPVPRGSCVPWLVAASIHTWAVLCLCVCPLFSQDKSLDQGPSLTQYDLICYGLDVLPQIREALKVPLFSFAHAESAANHAVWPGLHLPL